MGDCSSCHSNNDYHDSQWSYRAHGRGPKGSFSFRKGSGGAGLVYDEPHGPHKPMGGVVWVEPYQPGQPVWGAQPPPYRVQRLEQKLQNNGIVVSARHFSDIPVRSYHQPVGLKPATSCGHRAPEPTGRKKSLLVGINYFGTQAELKGCINDVHRMRGLISQLYGFPTSPDSMLVLADDNPEAEFRPLRHNILRGLKWLVKDVQPGDCLFFHYSGHGAQERDPNYSEEDGYDETICPADFNTAGMLVDDEIFDTLVAHLPAGAKLTAVMDCCHSGTGLDLPFVLESGGYWTELENPDHSAGDVVLISGCQDKQTSSDGGGAAGKPMGAMTTALCNTLEKRPSLTHRELLEDLRGELRKGGFSQLPNLSSSQKFSPKRPFTLTDSIEGNNNPLLGRKHQKQKHPKDPSVFLGGLGQMLSAGAMGYLASELTNGTMAKGLVNGIATTAADQLPGLEAEQVAGMVEDMLQGVTESPFGVFGGA